MSRDYFAVFGRLFRMPKFRRLSDSAQLTLFYFWASAGDTDPEATFSDAAELAGVLELQGRPPGDVADLIAAGWLDQLDDGRVIAHDWDQWQMAASVVTRKRYEADRKADWRRRQADPTEKSPHTPLEERDKKRGEVSGTRSRTSPGQPSGWREDASRHLRINGSPLPVGDLVGKLPPFDEAMRQGATANAAEGVDVEVKE